MLRPMREFRISRMSKCSPDHGLAARSPGTRIVGAIEQIGAAILATLPGRLFVIGPSNEFKKPHS